MPNITLKKSDKLFALEGMIRVKFLERYKSIELRRKKLALRVYNETYGKVGNQLKNTAGNEWRKWLRTKDSFCLTGFPVPALIIEGKPKNNTRSKMKDVFTGLNEDARRFRFITLTESVSWPESNYSENLCVADANKPTQKVAETLKNDITELNEESKQFYSQAYSVLMQLRSSRKVDEIFPELWEYLPVGTKERVKQAIVVINQGDVDALRSQLPNKSRSVNRK